MPVKQTIPYSGGTNAQIMNKIRKYASLDYRNRIPEATAANMQSTVQNLLTNTPQRNEFANALVNRIGMVIARNASWENPWNEFKIGLMQFGETIEEVQVGLVVAKVYNAQSSYLEKDIFGRKDIDVQSSFHSVNRTNYYEITIDEPILTKAFLDPQGLSSFIAQLMAAPSTSDNWDEFLLMTNLFSEMYNAGAFFKVNVPDVKALTSGEADSKKLLRAIITMAGKLPFISTYYNAAGMPISAKVEDLILFATPEVIAAIGVEALAAAFNLDYTNIPTRIIPIPDELMKITGSQAILTTKDFFVVADTRYEMTSAPNPVGLYQNFFLHHWQIVSASRFVPLILFTSTEATTVIPTVDTPVTSMAALTTYDSSGTNTTNLTRGATFGVVGSAITTPTGGVNDDVRLEAVGFLSPLSFLSNSGIGYLAPDDEATSITIIATSLDDNSKVATLVRPVVGDLLVLFPNPRVLVDSDKDGLSEVTPEVPIRVANNVTVPNTEGVIYKVGSTVVTDTVVVISASTTIVATAAAKFELATGATASWTFA